MAPSQAPSDAMMELLAPDGYYCYLQIPKPSQIASAASSNNNTESVPLNNDSSANINNAASAFDPEAVKKSYRKLSRKHHPDKPGGDADTFRVLKRAQTVLTNPKLREQYDILGIDLDDDEVVDGDHHDDGDDGSNENSGGSGTAEGIVHQIASMILSAIVQLGVRTLMMAGVSLILVRWPYTVYPAILFLLYIASTLLRQVLQKPATAGWIDVWPPLLIATGVFCMYRGRFAASSKDTSDNSGGDDDDAIPWTWLFWCGETLVISMFTYNSVSLPKSFLIVAACTLVAGLVALGLRGYVWNYVIVVGLEFGLALFVALAFPVLEMILQAVLNEKLKAVGDKVRAHHAYMQAYYENQARK